MLAYLFIIFAIAIRFSPHPMAFTPVGAALLFFGAREARRNMWIPLALLAASDVLLTTIVYRYPLSWDHFVTWAWYAGMILLGSTLKRNSGVLRIAAAVATCSVSFFVISNFAVWAAWGMYPHTISGLLACYDAGLPFFRHAIEGDALFTAIMFATPALLHSLASLLHQPADDHIAAA